MYKSNTVCLVILEGMKFVDFKAKRVYEKFWVFQIFLLMLSGALSTSAQSKYFVEFILTILVSLLKGEKVS